MNVLDGITFVFSGKFEGHTRKSIEALAVEHGATTLSGISKKADYLVAGAKMGESKRTKANKAGVPIISFEDFVDMINPDDASAFWDTDIDPDVDPAQFTQTLKQLDWDLFRPHEHGHHLRTLLTQQAHKYGVHDAHFYCSNQIKETLTLKHPFGHESEIIEAMTSPDGQWLATADWISPDHQRGGVLQIWEVETGRVVNSMRIEGCIGWDGYKTMAWHPESTLLALNYYTNQTGVWDPFDDSPEPIVYCMAAEGWSRPPDFEWNKDGSAIFIQCNIDWDGEDVDDLGCWMPVKGCRGDVVDVLKSGMFEDDKTKAPNVHQDKLKHATSVTEDAVHFPHVSKTYTMNRPEYQSPLIHPKDGEDYAQNFGVSPCFGVHVDGELFWATVFSQNAISAPPQFDMTESLNMALGHRYAWPLDWVDWLIIENSFQALCKDAKTDIPSWIKSTFKNVKPVSKHTPWPPELGKTHQDIVAFTTTTLLDLYPRWSDHVSDYLTQVALAELHRGDPQSAHKIMVKCPGDNKSWRCAQVAMHCFLQGFEEQGKALLKLAKKQEKNSPEHLDCAVYSHMAICAHLQGKPDTDLKQKAFAATEESTDHWHILNLHLMCGDVEAACAMLLEEPDNFDWDESREVLYTASRYLSFDHAVTLLETFKEIDMEEECYLYCLENIKNTQQWDRVDRYLELCDWEADEFLNELQQTLQNDPEALSIVIPIVLDFATEQDETDMMLRWIILATKHAPSLAQEAYKVLMETEDKDPTSESYYESTSTILLKGQIIALLNDEIRHKAYLTLDASDKATYLLGRAQAVDAKEAQALVTEAASLTQAYYTTEPDEYALEPDWKPLISSAFYCDHPDIQTLLALYKKHDEFFDLENIAEALWPINQSLALKVWMSILPGTRQHRGNLDLLCKFKLYDGLYDRLRSMEPTDLNSRGQSAVSVIETLSRQ